MAGGAAEHGRRGKADHAEGPVRAVAQRRAVERLSGAAGLQELGGRSATTSTSTIRFSSRASASPRRTRRATACRATSAATSTSPAATSSGRPGCRGTGRTSTTCSARPSAAARATRPSSATTGSCYNDEPRKLDAAIRLRVLRPDRHAARAPRTSRPISPGSSPAKPGSTTPTCKRSLGAVDDEKGITWDADLLRATA